MQLYGQIASVSSPSNLPVFHYRSRQLGVHLAVAIVNLSYSFLRDAERKISLSKSRIP